jgi:hypothetical protein
VKELVIPGSEHFWGIEVGMKIKKLGEFASELAVIGEKAFRENHARIFLVVVNFPQGEFSDVDMRTLDTNTRNVQEAGVYSPSKTTAEDMVIEVVKSSRNLFKNKITVGRAKNNDIILHATKISKLHCALVESEDEEYQIVDMDSLNGTIVNNNLLTKDIPVILKDGDILTLWEYVFMFVKQGTFLSMLRNLELGSTTSHP